MSPAIKEGDHFSYFIFKTAEAEQIKRFDIIVFKVYANSARNVTEDTSFVFRVVALEGEKVEIRTGKVFINDSLLEENFEIVASTDNFPPLIVPKDEYLVLGDNRPNSFDSRFWKYKTVKRNDLLGVVNTIIRKEDWAKGKRW